VLRDCKSLRVNERLVRTQRSEDAMPSSSDHTLASESNPHPSYELPLIGDKIPIHVKLPEHTRVLPDPQATSNSIQNLNACVDTEESGNADDEKRPLIEPVISLVRLYSLHLTSY
jgi:hypothetical protein